MQLVLDADVRAAVSSKRVLTDSSIRLRLLHPVQHERACSIVLRVLCRQGGCRLVPVKPGVVASSPARLLLCPLVARA
jgi:hypothetical protein